MSDSTFKRHLVRDVWVYEDSETMSAAIDWQAFYGFSLAELDNYLAADVWGAPKAQLNRSRLIDRRARALAAWRSENREASESWINFLQAAMQLGRQGERLLPLARLGDAHKDEQSARAKLPRNVAVHKALQAMVTRPENSELRAKELWQKVFDTLERLDLDPAEDIDIDTPAKPAYIYGIDRTRRLTFATFQGYVSKWRPKKKSG